MQGEGFDMETMRQLRRMNDDDAEYMNVSKYGVTGGGLRFEDGEYPISVIY